MAKLPRLVAMVVEDNILDYSLHGYAVRYAQQGGCLLEDTPVHAMINKYNALFNLMEHELRVMGVDTSIGDDE